MKATLAASLLVAMLASTPAPAQLATTVNDSSTTPAPPPGKRNVYPANDGGHSTVNVSHYVVYPTYQVNCLLSADLSAPVATALADGNNANGAILDARACYGSSTWATAITISVSNITLLLPCLRIVVTYSLHIAPGTRNTDIEGCGYMGSNPSTSLVGGTVWDVEANIVPFVVGDSTGVTQTQGFKIANMDVNVLDDSAHLDALDIYDTQEVDIENNYFVGGGLVGGTAIALAGVSNYAGGRIDNNKIVGFGCGMCMGTLSTGGTNATTVTRLHVDCPTSAGSPEAGGVGIGMGATDGNVIVGGDLEGCDTAVNLTSGADYNTFVGVRAENFNTQINAASGSSYNLWITGGTMLTGKLVDAGTHNSFTDAFHRGQNNLNGDLWRSQADTTVTNHVYTGIGLGNVRGRLDEFTTDVPGSPGTYQNAWEWGPGDGTAGTQVWSLQDMLNNVPRWWAAQLTTAGGNNQTGINSAGTGAIVLNGSANAGTGGVNFASGGGTPSTIASIDNAGNLSNLGRYDIFSGSTDAWRWSCASTSACSLQSMTPTANAYHLRIYNGSATEIDSEGSAAVVVNNTSTSGTGGFIVYEGSAGSTTIAGSVSGTGNGYLAGNNQVGSASGTGNEAIGNHLNQQATKDYGGTCATAGTATCTVALQHSYTSTPLCFAQPTTPSATAVACAVSSNTVTVTAAASTTLTYNVLVIGNPN